AGRILRSISLLSKLSFSIVIITGPHGPSGQHGRQPSGIETSGKTTRPPSPGGSGGIVHTHSSPCGHATEAAANSGGMPMYLRRQFLQGSLSMAALAALGPLLPRLSFAAGNLLQRAIPSSGESLPVIG